MAARARGKRRILGFTGAPGVGKSTYALAQVGASVVPAAYLPMDGFHLADSTLAALGRLDRKGAPDTFDAWGYAALLRRLREERDHVVYAPGFERDLEQPIAGAVSVPPGAELVVTEGNYLLLDEPAWRAVRDQLDEVVHLVVDDAVRRRRLVARHVAFGKSPAEAEAWVARVDEANAAVIEAAAGRADRVVELPAQESQGGSRGPDCPCGSGTTYDACCGPLHRGERPAATPEELMRSRYSAYAVGDLAYVDRTWHPRTRPAAVTPTPGLRWTGLEVHRAQADEVEFTARYEGPSGPGVLHEVSRFERRAGRWTYVDGDVG